jgi:hypothetical protein
MAPRTDRGERRHACRSLSLDLRSRHLSIPRDVGGVEQCLLHENQCLAGVSLASNAGIKVSFAISAKEGAHPMFQEMIFMKAALTTGA